MKNYPLIRKIYLYLFALIGLVMMVVGVARLVTLGLKVYVFTKADKFYEYPAGRQVKIPSEESKESEFIQPSKEDLEEYNKNQQSSNRQREAAESLGWIIVGLPLYAYHWMIISKEKSEEKNSDKNNV